MDSTNVAVNFVDGNTCTACALHCMGAWRPLLVHCGCQSTEAEIVESCASTWVHDSVQSKPAAMAFQLIRMSFKVDRK
jgi:hypothetical protein